ncbi:MAG: twin-arginine translocase TatA/TatE family subunit [Dehalococcoidia bacterium]|nr:twin-arginine translocase TatA/TatE family subunit [Dehalococcoidia bacterium]
MRLGPIELVLILVIVLLLFGASRLPGVAQGMGKALRSFKEAIGGSDEEKPKRQARKSSTEKPKS